MIRISRVNLEELQHLRNQILSNIHPADEIKDSAEQLRDYLCADYGNASLEDFQEKWRKGEAVVIQNVLPNLRLDWSPDYFIKHHGDEKADMVDCTSGCMIMDMTVGDFFRGFDSTNHGEDRLIMRIKDWPSDMDFKDKFPEHFVDFMKALPFREYTQRRGILNLASRLPATVVPPDLGPKMYIAYGSDDGEEGVGTTPLHLDMADAVNLMVYKSPMSRQEGNNDILPERDVSSTKEAGAVWDIFHFQDLPKIRQFLSEYAFEIGQPIDDPIHDQIFYLNKPMRQRLFEQYGVRGWRIHQNPGDVVFIPAGCAHQVCNYQNCIKVAMDFVSPESVTKCATLTREFRLLSQGHRRRQDLLQLESILYHSWANSDLVTNNTGGPCK
ncbi:Clavaminate synthase-like protein [Basidiobolus meristosporus CBS 931.73]|uniref:Clavaminate synthase-like protein n=1 Tax=Basidiobolus meristosporus CBS 931.73 TaxID=1314790 RepID=A0A1Y1ZCH8_9FUNG|nr:Clavaminate synthase-like protein [Basidiobolus meristosporus CBS 931.73]|eukprot:ORY07972.1 Clavaminate synthase-like protein [Basidiobolus meristosporus CBS 931.73]